MSSPVRQPPIVEFRDAEDQNRILRPISATIARTHGTYPNTIILEVAQQQDTIPLTGSLHVEFEGVTVDVPDCIVDASSAQWDPQRQTNNVILFDRRWKWYFGEISGNYNRRDESGSLISRKYGTMPLLNPAEDIQEWFHSRGERSPKDLAELCLEAMGEENYDTEALPDDDDVRPEIDWDMANPAQELNYLCELLGCRVVLSWDNRVRLHKLASGQQLPIDPPGHPIRRMARSIDVKQRPDAIAIKTSPIVYQMDLELEAVGLDTDGAIKPLADLSYHPDRIDNPNVTTTSADSWNDVFNEGAGIELGEDHEAQAALAYQTVFKWYRIKIPFTFYGLGPPTGEGPPAQTRFEVESMDRIAPIMDFRAATVIEDGRIKNAPSVVYGEFADPRLAGDNNLSDIEVLTPLPVTVPVDSSLIVPQGYSVDVAKGLIMFSQPVARYRTTTKTIYYPATLYYRACFSLRGDNGDRESMVIRRDQPKPWLGTFPLYVRRPELVPVTILNYRSDTFNDPETFTNEQTITEIANQYIDEIEKQFERTAPAMAEYVGLLPIELDGTIRSVVYRIGADGVFTEVNYNQDVTSPGNLSYVQMKRQDQIQRIMNDLRGGALPRALAKKAKEPPA